MSTLKACQAWLALVTALLRPRQLTHIGRRLGDARAGVEELGFFMREELLTSILHIAILA